MPPVFFCARHASHAAMRRDALTDDAKRVPRGGRARSTGMPAGDATPSLARGVRGAEKKRSGPGMNRGRDVDLKVSRVSCD